MTRTLHRLSERFVSSTRNAPGMHADGGGLYLRIAPGGSKQWVFRYTANGRLRDMGLGAPAPVGYTLAQARDKAREARLLRLEGIDPIEHRRSERGAKAAESAKAMTFRQCAEGYIKDNDSSWSNAKHRQQWASSLARLVYPVLGNLPVASIDTPLVLKVVKPLWDRTPETASRVRGRIENVLGWATVHHYRSGDNPARWNGLLEHALPKVEKGAEHFAALPYDKVADFVAKLRADTSIGARAIEFIVLTASRLNEALQATWDEIDFSNRVWTLPASRMKSGREHRVPLSPAAVAVLESMRAIRQSDYVFPGRRGPLHSNPPCLTAKRLAGSDITIHGFRSTFRDWSAERTNFPREVAEMALAHAIPSAVEAAYRRGDLFEKRRRLMDAWAEFCAKPKASGKVVPIGKRA
jgi:integrase